MDNLVVSIADYLNLVSGGDTVLISLYLGLIVAALTLIGSLPGLAGMRVGYVALDVGLGFSAGVMIVASFTSLLLPALEFAESFSIIAVGFLLGVFLIVIMDKLLPHEHFIKGYEGPARLKNKVKAAWLVALAIIIHNFPEGMAVGASTAFNVEEGVLMAIAIGVQDMPEGFAVAFPIAVTQKNLRLAFVISLLSGLSETLMAVLTALLASFFYGIIPFFMALAAGAMIYVVSHEIIPETHRGEGEKKATIGLIAGFLIMLWLDTSLG